MSPRPKLKGREHLTYLPVIFKRQFSSAGFKAMLQIFLYEESQIYVFETNIHKIFILYIIVYNKNNNNIFICSMLNKDENRKSTSDSTRVFLVDRYVCNYISTEWFDSELSDREHARQFGIHPNLIKKIKDKDGYKIPVSTLATICFNKGINLADFFNLLTKKYGDKINDDFIDKPKG